MRGECPHSGPNLDKVISGLGIESGDNRLGQVRIEKEILTEHLARPQPDLLETGAEFCFRHGSILKSSKTLVPAAIWNNFFTIIPKLFTLVQAKPAPRLLG